MTSNSSKVGPKYFAKSGTEPRAKGTISNPVPDLATQFGNDLSKASTVYRKVTSKIVVKRYATRKD